MRQQIKNRLSKLEASMRPTAPGLAGLFTRLSSAIARAWNGQGSEEAARVIGEIDQTRGSHVRADLVKIYGEQQ